MKKKLLSGLLCAAMVGTLFVGCGSSADTASTESTDSAATEQADSSADDSAAEQTGSASGTYALVPKSAGNPFNEKEADGFEEAIKALGGTAVVQYPESATADAQITVIESLISQGVDSICVAANDENALQSVLEALRYALLSLLLIKPAVQFTATRQVLMKSV